MNKKETDIDSLIEFRKKLHRFPETSGEESETAATIAKELKTCGADELHTKVGGTGVMALFKPKNHQSGKAILFRAELDGLSIHEQSNLPHQSEKPGKMHACGHDGHMTILTGLARYLAENRPENFSIYLLFQPAEETGEGAERILSDEKFQNLNIDHAFALHNLPGYKLNTVVVKKGTFASASVGLDITFEGKFSHAAYPEQGINPADTVGYFLTQLKEKRDGFTKRSEMNKMTATFVKMGEPAFGISPGTARAGVTVRASTDEEMEVGVKEVLKAVELARQFFGGSIHYKKVEPFTAVINSSEGVEIVKKAADCSEIDFEEPDVPFSWSEDFGEFRKKCPITLFGLGAGEKSLPLHSEKYDFNDELIPAGIAMFQEIISNYKY
ncbi:MAG: amidohydrolase [Balneolaceae bacterium]